ncbi:MAG: 2-dehydropantoate 2-reductase [Xanthomonadales bacterium]|nr:2-dehydropantoate 2-reductase [Gammaproteobacteria bacterium]MBT8050465.1 2-dehydropantoate 2-reductase [Gammaproteobacteria bacterium]MBT8055536.1 2-dehydropantoate 2-reductase [Gammaproteobacteria bacterium]NNJ79674.1 2-dehydropantoate 2-reductase [Xanthomonadales bacterium]NNL04332.1 2-dehydropantoate 2-reductase [Xanthomonadales bacterium]
MSTITVIGPGAIGGLVAAWLCQDSEHEIILAARTPFESLRLETPDGPLQAHPRVITSPTEARPSEWVLLATKAYDSEPASAWFPGSMTDGSRVAVLQNGVDHVERISEWVPSDRILPVIVDCPTERRAPGRIRQRGPVSMRVPRCGLAAGFVRLFDRTPIDCRQADDFATAAWRKLCINAAGAVNALTLEPAGVAHDSEAARLMRLIVEEAAAVGRAEGANLADDIADEVVAIYREQPPDAVNSLHADRLTGGPTEIDLRNGIVVQRGAAHGIPTPCNDMAVALLKVKRVLATG